MIDKQTLGYTKPLYILAFDQRSSFSKEIFGISSEVNEQEKQEIASYKRIIYEAFENALALGVPVEHAAFLCDEEFGDAILRDAGQKRYTFLLATERSGQREFDLNYGEEFAAHIEKYKPTFVKVLVRYNPEDDIALNKRQCEKMKLVSDYAHEHGYKFLIEALIPPTPNQMKEAGGESKRFDVETRPRLVKQTIKEIQDAGIEVDVWKIEGLEKREEYQSVVAQARAGGRERVSIVILGRHAPDRQVEHWLLAGRGVEGVIGFAIGRTIFWDPLVAVKKASMTPADAVVAMARKYLHFYRVFTGEKEKISF
ncbi:MAG: hypothetical protein A2722_01630 [Candidatus Doudnabacteria bacterium RIFCSPHIGHO2_01_FULL_50_11]|uniref:DUF2090 domain-containing protein n=1 Tax=Candidatus Doudnabacteria bacterium RIFCSPHIGHO2_01_FULL_50_11 TaxID=1817828 RepID=A0A1F5PE72_9BACT|nr:MAG: hypothetical protein A2722_01630 [Candidatus Doudnabacteria bacterium RIFCSPHIGHO2_01_FULL_50_11]HLC44309.1 DUF2090 domain-containing protein [Patescibacteria group bacterium]